MPLPSRRAPVGVAVTTVALLRCASPPPPAAAPAAPDPPVVTDAERFMPLKDDTVFSYDTLSENTGERGLLIMRVTRPRQNRADLEVAGRAERLEVVPDGIRSLTGGYVLKTPLGLGSTWKGRGGQVRVTQVELKVEVEAGRFTGCVETVEEARAATAEKQTTSVFCPGVGLVSLEVEAISDSGYARERAVLRSFGRRVDVHALAGE